MSFREYVKFPLSILFDITSIISFEGTWWLRSYEKQLIEAAAARLSPENKKILQKQLEMSFYVHRRHYGQVVYIHYHFLSEAPQMQLPLNYSLAKMRVRSKGGSTSVSIGCDTGTLFFIMYGKKPGPIFAHPFEIEKIEFGGEADQSVAKSIHNAAHGWDNPI
jgi:hypothetical protein